MSLSIVARCGYLAYGRCCMHPALSPTPNTRRQSKAAQSVFNATVPRQLQPSRASPSHLIWR